MLESIPLNSFSSRYYFICLLMWYSRFSHDDCLSRIWSFVEYTWGVCFFFFIIFKLWMTHLSLYYKCASNFSHQHHHFLTMKLLSSSPSCVEKKTFENEHFNFNKKRKSHKIAEVKFQFFPSRLLIFRFSYSKIAHNMHFNYYYYITLRL